MNYATLLGYTLLLATACGVGWGFHRLGRILDAFEARMGARIDAAVPVSAIPLGELHEIADRLRERAAR